MLFDVWRQLKVYPPCSVVKVGDTVVDILEGKNAGAWSIGILKGSNLLGLSEEEYNTMDADKLKKLKKETTDKYLKAGADIVIDTICDLPQAIEEINRRMKMEAER